MNMIAIALLSAGVLGQFDTFDAIQDNIKATKAYRDDGDHWTQHVSCIRPGSIRCYSRPVWYVGEDGERYRIDKDVSLDGEDWRCDTNSIQFRLTASGQTWYRTGQYGVRLSLRESASIAGGSQVETVPAAIPTIAKSGHGLLSVTGALPDATIVYMVLPGVVKEAVVLEKKPKNLTGDSYVIVWDWVAEGLTPIADGDEIDWATAESATPMRFAPPHVVDVDGAVIPSTIEIDGQAIVLSIPAGALKDAKYPVTIDPTATTDDADHSNGVAIGQDTDGDVWWGKSMGRIVLPDLTGFTTIDSASLYLYGLNAATSALTFDVHFDIIGSWASSDSIATLNALTWNAATDDDNGNGIVLGWAAYDILGSVGMNGIAEIYDNDPSGGTGSYLILDTTGTPTPDTKNVIALELGDEANPADEGVWSLAAGYEPYVEIVYDSAGAGSTGRIGIGSTGPIMGY